MLALGGALGCGSVRGGGSGAAVLEGRLQVFDAVSYPGLFEASKGELRARGFLLDRVDARGGVITTRGLLSAGAITPWVGGAGVGSALDDAMHRNERVVRIVFSRSSPSGVVSVDRAGWAGSGGRPDLRLWRGAISVRVEVDVFRDYSSSRRLNADSVRLSHDSVFQTGLDSQRSHSAGARVERVGADGALAQSVLDGVLKRFRGD